MAEHLMIDIETLDTEKTAAILSIAAVVFDPEVPGYLGTVFNRKISLASNLRAGRTTSVDTLEWWSKQAHKAKADLADCFLDGPSAWSLDAAIENFHDFLINGDFAAIWANSPSFDLEIIRNAMKHFGVDAPWQYWQERDVRTVRKILPSEFMPQQEKDCVEHVALDDCNYQISIVHAAQSMKEMAIEMRHRKKLKDARNASQTKAKIKSARKRNRKNG